MSQSRCELILEARRSPTLTLVLTTGGGWMVSCSQGPFNSSHQNHGSYGGRGLNASPQVYEVACCLVLGLVTRVWVNAARHLGAPKRLTHRIKGDKGSSRGVWMWAGVDKGLSEGLTSLWGGHHTASVEGDGVKYVNFINVIWLCPCPQPCSVSSMLAQPDAVSPLPAFLGPQLHHDTARTSMLESQEERDRSWGSGGWEDQVLGDEGSNMRNKKRRT